MTGEAEQPWADPYVVAKVAAAPDFTDEVVDEIVALLRSGAS